MFDTKTLRGPGGIKVQLDRSQIFPDDPGQGTPAIVVLKNASSTYNCACGEGELFCDDHCGVIQLTDAQLEWLGRIEDEIEDFLWPR
ncbi:MAG: hypothetical protein WC390_10100 [Sulfurimonas sp.]|jgi:hypothetical protein